MSIDNKLRKLGFHSSQNAFDEALKQIKLRKDGEIVPYRTSWERFNRMLGGGIQPSTIYTVGGRPGVGKSAFVNKLLLDICDLNDISQTVICYWTWEMPAYQQVIRGFSGKFGQTVQELMSAHEPVSDQFYDQLLESRDMWMNYPLYFMSYSKTPDYIYALCKEVQALQPGIRFINIFDHTRLAKKQKNMYSEEEKISRLYHAAQQLSVNYGMINIFLSQLNRDIESESRKRLPVPKLSDFFGADSVAQFSNVAIILNQPAQYRIAEYIENENTENLLAVHTLKNRDGRVGWIPFDHNLAHNTMHERYPLMETPTYQM